MSPAAAGPARRMVRTRMPRVRTAALALALLPLLGGCISEKREEQLGRQIAANVNARVPLVEDVPLNLYVSQLGQLIARHSARPDITYRFYIVDTGAVNAFALPGGYVYVDRGLIERTHDVSELSGVLAHEIAHVALRHGAKTLQRQMRTSSMSTVLYRTILGRDPLLDQQALQLGNQLWSSAHSRADEAEADREAVKYLIASGVDPRGMISLFQGLLDEERHSPSQQTVEWFSSHPNTQRRLSATRASIAQLMPPHPRLARNNASYPLFLQRMEELPGARIPFPVPVR